VTEVLEAMEKGSDGKGGLSSTFSVCFLEGRHRIDQMFTVCDPSEEKF
jgi:hypothetical protein